MNIVEFYFQNRETTRRTISAVFKPINLMSAESPAESKHESGPMGSYFPLSKSSGDKPSVLGIFGVPGSGKSYILGKLKERDMCRCNFYEGSEVLDGIVPGGLKRFEELDEASKSFYRKAAIQKVQSECAESKKMGYVAGQYMAWDEDSGTTKTVLTDSDWETYTHMFFLDIPAEVIHAQRRNDSHRRRGSLSVDQLRTWNDCEKEELQRECDNHGIPLFVLSPTPSIPLETGIAER
ncbi:hypothetical protein BT63DRAFT_311709 [Microthyrium microscopicum]|uniref:P-loop containing nucleoside triphosphate hydrolase protein n=1 Tax=Microthyrium microscopicum TaxID=703497 RepID=A0A6A6U569_9PEZI|nr:hypothetical protein BT63DRAFT_311709 [Microthyrium microscopicum]